MNIRPKGTIIPSFDRDIDLLLVENTSEKPWILNKISIQLRRRFDPIAGCRWKTNHNKTIDRWWNVMWTQIWTSSCIKCGGMHDFLQFFRWYTWFWLPKRAWNHAYHLFRCSVFWGIILSGKPRCTAFLTNSTQDTVPIFSARFVIKNHEVVINYMARYNKSWFSEKGCEVWI